MTPEELTDMQVRGDCLKMALAFGQTMVANADKLGSTTVTDCKIVEAAKHFYNFITANQKGEN